MREVPFALMLLALGACAGAAIPPPPTALSLSGPVVPLATPVQVPRDGWGPFTRSCTHLIVEAEPPLQAPGRTARTCFAFRAAPLGQGEWRITGYPADADPDTLNISLVRAADGTISAIALGGTALQRASQVQRQELEQMVQDLASGAGSSRRTLTQGGTFTNSARLPPGFTGTLSATCTVQGAATLAGRQVVIADCAGATPTSMAPNRDGVRFRGDVTVRGPAAIDVESGLVVATVMTLRMAGVFSSDATGRSVNAAFRSRVASAFE